MSPTTEETISKEDSKVPENMPSEPDPRSSAYITIEQAAFIMQETPATVRDWIEKGLIFSLRTSTGGRLMIHQSELDRFRHPWKHIWRLDRRISALQGLLLEFQKKIIGGENIQETVLHLNVFCDSIDAKIVDIEKAIGEANVRISKTEIQPKAVTEAQVKEIFVEMFCGHDLIIYRIAAIEKTLGSLTKDLLTYGQFSSLKPSLPPEHGPSKATKKAPRRSAKRKKG